VRHVAALKTFEQATVARAAAAPLQVDEADVLAGVPQCRREWSVPWRSAWVARLTDAGAPPSSAARIAAQLRALDAALLRFSRRPEARAERPLGLDAARWFGAATRTLDRAVESADYPGLSFAVRCADLEAALHALSRADASMLQALAWRGATPPAAVARWQPEQQVEISAHHVMRRNPWNGIAGCIYFAHAGAAGATPMPAYFLAGERSPQRRVCARPDMAGFGADATGASATLDALAGEPGPADAIDDPRWMVPPSLQTMLQPLEALRQPSTAAFHAFNDVGDAGPGRGRNRIVLDGAPVDVGFSIDLTIDPALQALAQKTAACYAGRHDVCQALALHRNEDKDRPLGEPLLEGAMVRTAAIAIVDVASGRIEALAGAMSPCARQAVEGPLRASSCDRRVPYAARYRPDALLNPAVFHDAMPASTIKPIMAAAFLADAEVGARWLGLERGAMARDATPARESLRGQLMRSDSARFLDRMFCLDKGFAGCQRPWEVQAMAAAFGWNANCDDARASCGRQDLLFGRAPGDDDGAAAPATPVAYGRLLAEPEAGRLGAAMHLRTPAVFRTDLLRRCAEGPDGKRTTSDDWEKCRGGAMVDVVAEGWGQGHARATALGVAGMMASLAAAANGQREIRRPHLVESLHAADGTRAEAFEAAVARWRDAARRPNEIPQEAAEVILSGLSYSHRAGTARSACEQVFDARRCRDIAWLAGKTGTPSFPSDGIALDDLQKQCGHPAAAPPTGVCSSLRPYKWYVAAYRSDQSDSGPWDKVIAVLTERNWIRRTGQIHGAGDQGPNPSAEIAMQIAVRHAALSAPKSP
jgi:hypothetical protein